MSRYLWQIREELRIFVKAEAIESNPCQDLGNTNSIIRKEPVIETLKHRLMFLENILFSIGYQYHAWHELLKNYQSISPDMTRNYYL